MTAAVTLRLPHAAPYAVRPLLHALAAHAVPGLEHTDLDAGTHTRAISAPGGPGVLQVRFADDDAVGLRLRLTDPDDAPAVATSVRRWLDLDADPAPVDVALGADPVLASLVAARPGLRILGALDGFEAAMLAVLGQQVSLAAARTFGGRLVAAYGGPGLDGHRRFPTAERVATVPAAELQAAIGITSARARTLLALSGAVAGGLRIAAEVDHGRLRRALLALPGVGPWTVDCLAVRVLGDRDAFAPSDLVLRRALRVTTAAQADALSQRWRPFRAYALFHLWTSAAYTASAS